ncbi:MAG: methyltransferase domain-containing protein [Pseudanabaena sp.]|jgi:SAM-dependent methyltransferase|nr:methyltransferase domain-containing protein [Pseudanabaena sp. M051S1SP1A06QC]
MAFALSLKKVMHSNINYNHSQNLHILDAPSIIFPIINSLYNPKSILDVGCGLGTWLKVISDSGIEDFVGIDGIEVRDEDFFVSKENFQKYDLKNSWDIGRKFDLLFCLEVAEHLPSNSSTNFIQNLIKHSDTIIFSAACPYQPGQGHINCQWIDYWQDLFNKYGYACFDEIRPLIWNKNFPEWWYKQNIFIAKKDEVNVGKEPRIISMVHPDLYESYVRLSESFDVITSGNASFSTYLQMLIKSVKKLIFRRINK